jgi:hypothetical protein
MSRKGISQKRCLDASINAAVNGRPTPETVIRRDSALKTVVASLVEQKLHDLRSADLPLADKGQGSVSVLHKLAQTAALVEDWGSDRIQTVVGVSITERAEALEEPPVDVESVTEVDNATVPSPESA